MQGADRNNNVEIERKQTGRRALLTAAGLIAAAGVPAAVSALERNAGGGARKWAWWVKAVDRPTLGETTADFKRFSGANIFEIYRQLKTEREGAGSFEAEQTAKAKRLAGWMRGRKPGYRLPDHQLSEGAWTLMKSAKPGAGLLSWTRIAVSTPAELGVERHTASPEEMAQTVKAAARLYGAGLVGIAPMNESYVNLRQAKKDIVFEDTVVPAMNEAYVNLRQRLWHLPGELPLFESRPGLDSRSPT
jgi:hypothetical protein